MPDFHFQRSHVRRSFDRAAASYDQAAALQRRVADHLLSVVDGIVETDPPRILDAGCGTGYGAVLLAQRFPCAALSGFDLAPGMLHATRQRLPHMPLFCGDMQSLPLASDCVDLFWSSLMLQWCDRLDLAFTGARSALALGGRFVFSTFGPATLSELRNSFDDGHAHVSRFAAPTELEKHLRTAGFVDVHIETRTEILHYPDVKSLMLELKAIGAHNAAATRKRGLTGKRAWQAMLANYESLRSDAGLPASYEVVYAVASA
ncbi:MAG TPA: malonyl-ACP O-methyltransferase BioC [Rhodocyclaceae bacterium]|nr:malonyl-ACP O-methyltransferase BioC [Rhodocyclaceae bacterium]